MQPVVQVFDEIRRQLTAINKKDLPAVLEEIRENPKRATGIPLAGVLEEFAVHLMITAGLSRDEPVRNLYVLALPNGKTIREDLKRRDKFVQVADEAHRLQNVKYQFPRVPFKAEIDRLSTPTAEIKYLNLRQVDGGYAGTSHRFWA